MIRPIWVCFAAIGLPLATAFGVAAEPEAPPPGSGVERPLAYFDQLYAGLSALYDLDTALAIEHFRSAGVADQNGDQLDRWERLIGRWMPQIPERKLEAATVGKLVGRCDWVKFWFLTELVHLTGTLPEASRPPVMDFFCGMPLDRPPWNVPALLACRLTYHRAQLCEKLGERDTRFHDLAVADYQYLAGGGDTDLARPKAMLKVANRYYQRKEHAKAVALYDAILAQSAHLELRDMALLNKGKSLIQLRDFAGAEQAFTELLRRHTESPHAQKARKYQRYVRKKLRRQGRSSESPGRVSQ